MTKDFHVTVISGFSATPKRDLHKLTIQPRNQVLSSLLTHRRSIVTQFFELPSYGWHPIKKMYQSSSFHRPQRFVFRNGLPMEEISEKKVAKTARVEALLGNNAFRTINAPVLTFDAYYCDPLGEGNKGTTRYRKCKVLYFLADDEMKVFEPRQKNSGLEQGCIVGKGRFYRPEGGYYTFDDLNVGESIELFGRRYKLINCDDFTRRFLAEMGYHVGPPEPDIADPITEDRNETNVPKSYRRPCVKHYKAKSFYEHHPKCLRFFGCYGDGKQLFEERREVTLYYDLASGTIRIVEERVNARWTDGRTDNRVLLRPTRVPKNIKETTLIGDMCDPTLLNHAHDEQTVLIGGKYYKVQNPISNLVDPHPLEGRRKAVDYYTDKDLDLGKKLNIFGNEVFLYDCDEFTRNFFRATYDKELLPVPRPEIKPFNSHKLVSQHELFGEPEQTIRTNDPFMPIKYQSDLRKFFKNDRQGYNVKELKFLARIVSEDPIEKRRNFLVRWYLEDDTMDIRSLDQDFDNTSIIDHKYLRRMKIIKPRSAVGNYERCYYEPKDMYVGNVVYVRSRAYLLTEADEYTYDYMERHCHMFPHSHIKRILTTLRQWTKDNFESLQSMFKSADPSNTGGISYDNFRSILNETMSQEMRVRYPEQTLKTLARHYAKDEYIGLKREDLASKIKTELYRMKFYDVDDLKLTCEMHDENRSGYLTAERLYFALRSSSVPLNRDLMKSYIFKFPATDKKIKYSDFLESIDWIKHNTQYETQDPAMVNINWEHVEHEKGLDHIQYPCFLADMVF